MCEALGVTRSAAQKMLDSGDVTLSGEKIAKNYKLREGDALEVTFPEERELDVEPEDIPLNVVYEDGDIIVIDKPAGMVVHPAPGHETGTLVSALMYHCRGSLSHMAHCHKRL